MRIQLNFSNGNLKKRRNGKKKSKRDDVVEDLLADVAYRISVVMRS